MKTKSLAFTLLVVFILTFSITAIYAEDVTVGSSTFELPDGFKINETENNTVTLENNNYFLTVYEGDIVSTEEAKQNREEEGYELLGEDTYDAEGVSINQQNYKKDNIVSNVYTFTKNDKNYIITLNTLESQPALNSENNPVTHIISSLK